MKIFFTGITGLIGRYFFETNPAPDRFEIFGTSEHDRVFSTAGLLRRYEALPFADVDAYAERLSALKPDVIVHAGGQGDVDAVERDPESWRHDNLEFPLFLMEQAVRCDALVVQVSSNAVYDGFAPPYSETSAFGPVNHYGRFKALVDAETRRHPGRWMILRPTIAYGWNFPFGRKNTVTRFLPELRAGRPLRLVNDVFENPVYAGDVAAALWACLSAGYEGELNVAGGDAGLSRFDWLKVMSTVFGCDPALVTAASSRKFSTLAPRPRDTRFDTARMRQLGLTPLTVRQGAEAMARDTRGS